MTPEEQQQYSDAWTDVHAKIAQRQQTLRTEVSSLRSTAARNLWTASLIAFSALVALALVDGFITHVNRTFFVAVLFGGAITMLAAYGGVVSAPATEAVLRLRQLQAVTDEIQRELSMLAVRVDHLRGRVQS